MRPHRPCQELRKLSGSRSIWLRHRRFATPAKCQGCGRKARIIAANEVYPVSVWQDSPSCGCSRVLMRHAPPRACTAAFLVDDKASGRPCRRTLPAIYKSGAAYVMLVKARSREFHSRHASISPEFGCRKIERCACNISRLIHSRQFRVLNATFFRGIPG